MRRAAKNALLATGGVTLLVLIAARLLGPPAIEDQAVGYARAIEDGNVGVLGAYQLPAERRLLGLTPDKIERVWQEVILPLRRDWKKVGPREKQRTSDGGEGTSYQDYTDAKGRRFFVGSELFATDDGPKATLSTAISLTFAMAYAPEDTPHGYLVGSAIGSRRWAVKLASLGMSVIYAHGKAMSWDSYASECDDEARRMDRTGVVHDEPPAPNP